jgi:hypothetical protein
VISSRGRTAHTSVRHTALSMPDPLQPPKRALDDLIAEHLDAARASGELASAKSWGKPLDLGDGWDDTPPELRMPMKILKDAGVVPHEVALMHEIDALRRRIDAGEIDAGERHAARRRLAEMQQDLALRLERLRATGSL